MVSVGSCTVAAKLISSVMSFYDGDRYDGDADADDAAAADDDDDGGGDFHADYHAHDTGW